LIHTEYQGGDENAPATEMNPDGTLKLFVGYPTVSASAAMFSFAINPDSTFIGSGALDGEGIPPDFFTDINVRKGFSYCFDWDTFIEDALKGEGVQSKGPIIQGLQGYDANSETYNYDLDKCGEYLAEAWDGQLPETGFKMTIAYNQGNETRETAAQILADNLSLVDAKYQIEVIELEWPSFLEARRNQEFPLSVSGWLEDYHDASNWVHPYMHSAGAYGRAQGFPEELSAVYDAKIDEGIQTTDATERAAVYAELQKMANDDAISIWLEQATGRFYINKDVSGWFTNPLTPGLWYYSLNKGQ
jgi:peptide/nickel transport system substrate-binding protein